MDFQGAVASENQQNWFSSLTKNIYSSHRLPALSLMVARLDSFAQGRVPRVPQVWIFRPGIAENSNSQQSENLPQTRDGRSMFVLSHIFRRGPPRRKMWATPYTISLLFYCLVLHTSDPSVVRIGIAMLPVGAWSGLASIAGVAFLSRISRITLVTRPSGVACVPPVTGLACIPRLSLHSLLSGLPLRAILSGRSRLPLRCRCWCRCWCRCRCCLRWRCLATCT
jgi:hypothetical protein